MDREGAEKISASSVHRVKLNCGFAHSLILGASGPVITPTVNITICANEKRGYGGVEEVVHIRMSGRVRNGRLAPSPLSPITKVLSSKNDAKFTSHA